MSGIELACETSTLKAVLPASGGTFVILPIGGGSLGSKVRCQGNQVYTSIAFTVTGVVAPGVASGSGAGTIIGTATKVLGQGQALLRKGDSTTITVTDTSPPYGSASVTVEVDDPGQVKAKGV